MDLEAANVRDAVNRLVDDYRARCLWSLRADYYPGAVDEQLAVLGSILRCGDRDGYRRASVLQQWLLQNSSAVSVAR
jgi:hypothetical protein